jgi:asparaginyl-tRNA synthetase
MVEPEVAYANLDDVMQLAEGLVVSVVARVLDRRRQELKVLERDTTRLERVQGPFPRISYDEAAETLKKKDMPFEWGGDFGAPDETALSEEHDRPLFVHGFPSAIKAFYMKPHPDRPEVSLSVDLLAPEGYGEIIGGGQRIDDLALLVQRIKEHNLPQEAFEWYLDLRRFGSVPHGGFGMGIERVVTWICGIDHLREAIPYPRMLYRMYP